MPEITQEQRECWRAETGIIITSEGRLQAGRLLDTLHALEAAERERDELLETAAWLYGWVRELDHEPSVIECYLPDQLQAIGPLIVDRLTQRLLL